MVTKYGMYTEIGTLNLSNDDYSITKPYSEKTAELIDQLVKKIVEEQYNQAVTLIQSKKHDITIMA